ncbi:MAG: hypothetical protein EPN37_16005 [Chitinophagaceae bacterium]|nr:MAG: hypothetical protein EPN37_16005 [Chitinophagaceae bacterium]
MRHVGEGANMRLCIVEAAAGVPADRLTKRHWMMIDDFRSESSDSEVLNRSVAKQCGPIG